MDSVSPGFGELMPPQTEERKTKINWISVILGTVPGIITVVALFSVMRFQVNAQADDIKTLYGKTSTNTTAITEIKGDVQEVKNDVSDIKDDVKDIQVEQVAQGKLLERILVEVSKDDGTRRRNN